MSIITAIIFSLDRPMQLDLLLDSIVTYDRDKLFEVNIIYSYSNQDFEQGYLQLINKYPGFLWHKEQTLKARFVLPIFPIYWHNYFWWFKYKRFRWNKNDFKNRLINIVKLSKNEFLMFLTDDSTFYNPIVINTEALTPLKTSPLDYCYSLRHGVNIFGGEYSKHLNLIYWLRNGKHKHPEWSHPFSVDGHIYNLSALSRILETVIYNNPNTLEGNIACYTQEQKIFNNHIANEQSCLLGFELNRVQTIVENNNLHISNKMLNKMYLDGYKLNLNYSLPTQHLFRPLLQSVFATKEHDKVLLYEYQ